MNGAPVEVAIPDATPSRLRSAAFVPISEEGRADMVVGRLVQAVSVGAFVEGERLPSENDLALLLGVAVDTVREALATLRFRGVVETRRGRNGGSFIRSSCEAVEEANARALLTLPGHALSDLAVEYEVISAACAEYAARRASEEELELLERALDDAVALPRLQWRRRVTEVQLELAALSLSERLTSEHLRLQTEFTPLLSLQDGEPEARRAGYQALAAQIAATKRGDPVAARAAVHHGVRLSLRWLSHFRTDLLSESHTVTLHEQLEARRGQRKDTV